MVELAPTFQDFVCGAENSVVEECELDGRSVDTEPLLNGVAYKVYRENTDVTDRRATGTFFTGSTNARQLALQLHEAIPTGSVVMDPTCGIGDLLLAYAEHLPLQATLHKTLTSWGKQLAGFDLDADLIRLTKTRLILQARLRGGFANRINQPDRYFPRIQVGDMMRAKNALNRPGGFLFNPPFGIVKDVEECAWSAGSVNAAALFLAELIKHKKETAPISAILPEVLRCGTRYKVFRTHLENRGVTGSYTSLGRFDAWADVDVFSTLIMSSAGGNIWDIGAGTEYEKHVGDEFHVHVGAVVPHRHLKKGKWHRYICAKTTPRWRNGFEPKSSRRFDGTVFSPPFVVVRRTSSPSDRNRAVASVIVGDRAVAVENHLLVLLPKDESLESCQRLLKVLGTDLTNDYLNTSIRCRHLTTGIVARIPWPVSDD